ncbi:hypothetical protein M569_07183, partial [Genlisea aurea]
KKSLKKKEDMPGSLEQLDVAGVEIPYHFRCPISLELMRDPVTVCTGQTYDRSSIESWIVTGNTTCPATRTRLTDLALIPNHTLRRLIQDWCVANHASGVERIPTPKQPAEPVLIRNLLNRASSGSASFCSRISAVRRLRGLARDSEKNRSAIASSDGRRVFVSLLFADVSSEPSELNLESLAIISMLGLSEQDCLYLASDLDRVKYLVNLLSHSSIDVRINSAAAIEMIVAGVRSSDLRAQIGSLDGVFEGIVGILNYPLANPHALKIGIKALFALCLAKQHRHVAVSAGAAGSIINRLAEFEKCEAEKALATVELLCRIPDGRAAFASHPLTIPLLVKIILKISDRATEYASGALLSLCTMSDQTQAEAVAAGVLNQLILLVQSDCTERAKRKAQMLLKLLRNSWPQDDFEYHDDFGG